jgi:hypothetical protein
MKFTDSQIIDLLGGCGKVSRMCKVGMSSVTHWRTRGIPTGQRLLLAARIEKETHGVVTRREMFPEDHLLIWPELKDKNESL